MFKQGQFFATKRHVTVHHVSAVALKRCWTLLATDFFYVATLCVVLMHCISSVAGFFGADESFDLFKGYSVYTWLLVIFQVFTSLILSSLKIISKTCHLSVISA